MTTDEYYQQIDILLGAILENIDKIVIVSQTVLILICGIVIYHLFWGARR